jgi:hypothetical protein
LPRSRRQRKRAGRSGFEDEARRPDHPDEEQRREIPNARVQKFISGDDSSLLSQGSREMPVWGPTFHQIEDQDFGNVRLQNLIKYLETIQQE